MHKRLLLSLILPLLFLLCDIDLAFEGPWRLSVMQTPACCAQGAASFAQSPADKPNPAAAQRLRAEGEAFQKKGQLQAAIEKYEESQKYVSDPRLTDHVRTLREALNKQYVEAAKRLRAEGEVLQKQGNIKGSIEKYQAAQRYYPDPKLAEHVTALQKATRKPKLELEGAPEGFREELALLDKIKKDPSQANIDALAEVRYQYALTLTQTATRKKDVDAYKLAFMYAQSATDLSPDNGNYWVLLGQLYDNLGDDPLNEIMAEDALQRAVALSADDVRKRLLLGQFYFDHSSYTNAMEQFETAVKKNPIFLSAPMVSTMCASYVLSRQSAKGIAFFKGMVTNQPNPDITRLGLAILLHETKDTAQAAEELARIINRKDASAENREYALLLLEDWKKEGVKP